MARKEKEEKIFVQIDDGFAVEAKPIRRLAYVRANQDRFTQGRLSHLHFSNGGFEPVVPSVAAFAERTGLIYLPCDNVAISPLSLHEARKDAFSEGSFLFFSDGFSPGINLCVKTPLAEVESAVKAWFANPPGIVAFRDSGFKMTRGVARVVADAEKLGYDGRRYAFTPDVPLTRTQRKELMNLGK